VIVAVIDVRIMQVITDAVVGVVAVGHRLMPATRAMGMSGVMPTTGMTGGAMVRVGSRHRDHVLVDVPFMRMMEMAIVKVVCVPIVAHRLMAAAGIMLMRMTGMLAGSTGRHQLLSFQFEAFVYIESCGSA
jgi:hypothetical protein